MTSSRQPSVCRPCKGNSYMIHSWCNSSNYTGQNTQNGPQTGSTFTMLTITTGFCTLFLYIAIARILHVNAVRAVQCINSTTTTYCGTTDQKLQVPHCPRAVQIGALPSILTRPDTPVWEIWTRPHSVCCVASWYLSHSRFHVKILQQLLQMPDSFVVQSTTCKCGGIKCVRYMTINTYYQSWQQMLSMQLMSCCDTHAELYNTMRRYHVTRV